MLVRILLQDDKEGQKIMFDALPDGGTDRVFPTKDSAIFYVQQFEAGEVRRIEDDLQVWVHYPTTQWV